MRNDIKLIDILFLGLRCMGRIGLAHTIMILIKFNLTALSNTNIMTVLLVLIGINYIAWLVIRSIYYDWKHTLKWGNSKWD